MNFAIIKSDKYDRLINNVLYSALFIHQLAFLFSVSALVTDTGIISYVHKVITLTFVIMCSSIFYYFVRGKFSFKEIAIYIVIAIPLLISLYNYRNVMIISNLFYIAMFKNVDARKSMKVVLYATITGFLFNVLLSLVTKYPGDVGQFRHGMDIIRHGLGFRYAYFPSYYYMTIVLTYMLTVDKINMKMYVVLLAFNILVFILADTRAAFTYTMLAIILHMIFVNYSFNILDKIFSVLTILSYPIATLFSILFPMLYVKGVPAWEKFNHIVSGRLYLTQNTFNYCGITFWGQTASTWMPGERHIDSAIAMTLVQNGIVVLVMAVVFLTFFLYMAVKIKNKPLMIVLAVMALRGTFDMGFLTFQLGPVVILFYETLYKFLKKPIISNS